MYIDEKYNTYYRYYNLFVSGLMYLIYSDILRIGVVVRFARNVLRSANRRILLYLL